MFDISFTELMLAGVVALVVIGPEKLPKVARTVGHLLGRAQRYVNDVKGDIQREVEFDELRKMKQEMESAAQSVQSSFTKTESDIRQGLQEPIESIASLGDDPQTEGLAKSLRDDPVDDRKDDTKDEFDDDYQPIMKPARDSLNGLVNVPTSGAKVQPLEVESAERFLMTGAGSTANSETSATLVEPKT